MLKITEKYMALSAACMLMLSACSSDEKLSVADKEGGEETPKTPIELTVGIVGQGSSSLTRGVTRNVVTTDKDNNKALAFEKGTSLYMVIQSEDGSDANDNYTRTIGYAQTKETDYKTTVDFATAYKRYWEDGQSTSTRDSRISIYSACVPGYYYNGTQGSLTPTEGSVADGIWTIGGLNTYENSWNTTSSSTTIAWPLRNASSGIQDATFIKSQDLCFSNNVSNPSGGSDNRIKFDSSTKKFTNGHLIFYHALTWVTFKIKKGDGFGSTDFTFSNDNENIVLKGFNTSGTFDITTGEFQATPGTGAITQLAGGTAETGYEYVLDCLMLPGSALNGSDKDDIEKIYFTIANNKYHLTKAQLATALADKTTDKTSTSALDEGKMRPGVHYVFTMTVGKQKMDKLTAAVVEWEQVTADETTPTNARINISLLDKSTHKTGAADFDFYRAANISLGTTFNDAYESYDWTTGYTLANCKAYLTENSTAGQYTANDIPADLNNPGTLTPWYWPDNKTFYHFRTVMPKNHDVIQNNDGDYISLSGGPYIADNNDGNYKDVSWGAPFYKYQNSNTSSDEVQTLTYSLTTGFDNTDNTNHQISKAIGPTTGTINMVMFHMMSDVTISLTTNTGGADAVNLTNAKMELSNIYPTGTVKMGNGLVTPTGVKTTVNNVISDVNTVPWRYGFVPQSLEDVVLTITTADNNQYLVNMNGVKATSVGLNLVKNPYSQTDGKYVIDRWYPNFKYDYTFKLTKTGIALITATMTGWVEVKAGDDNVVIQ